MWSITFNITSLNSIYNKGWIPVVHIFSTNPFKNINIQTFKWDLKSLYVCWDSSIDYWDKYILRTLSFNINTIVHVIVSLSGSSNLILEWEDLVLKKTKKY